MMITDDSLLVKDLNFFWNFQTLSVSFPLSSLTLYENNNLRLESYHCIRLTFPSGMRTNQSCT